MDVAQALDVGGAIGGLHRDALGRDPRLRVIGGRRGDDGCGDEGDFGEIGYAGHGAGPERLAEALRIAAHYNARLCSALRRRLHWQ